MGVLDGFLSTWSNAKATFGEGAPQGGAQFDASGPLNQLKSDLDSAAPGSRWTGTAAAAYGAANSEHQRVIGELGGLDKRLAVHVDESARIVTAGRNELDAVRKWVVDAAGNVPNNAEGQRMLVPIVNKGIGQVVDIVQKTNGELGSIAGKVRGIRGEYAALGNQKFAPKDGKGDEDVLGVKGDESDDDVKKRAKEDVEKTLKDGDQEAAGRVEKVLGTIKPYNELSPEQAAYLNEMQRQQAGMSIPALHKAEEQLGDKKHIIGDSWQLMSNDDVPRDSGKFADQQKGGFDRLPDSVQKILSQNGLASPGVNSGDVNDVKAIAQIVKDGHSELQQGTELDRGMMRLGDRIMDDPNALNSQEDVVRDIFDSAGRDHTIVRDMVTGIKGDDGDDFLHDINNTHWRDDGKSAGNLFSWTNEAAHGPDAQIAAETAEKVAGYLGTHPDLMHMGNFPHSLTDQTLGQINPDLVRAYSHGLTPYMADIASLDSANRHDAFDLLDPGNPERPHAKNLFAVLSTDEQAYKEFNGAADALTIQEAHQYADDVKNHVPVNADDRRLLDVGVLKGLVADGSTSAAHAMGINHDQLNDWRKGAFETGKELAAMAATAAGGPAGGVAIAGFGGLLESSIVGTGATGDGQDLVIPNMGADESARLTLNALIADGVHVPGMEQLQPFMKDGQLLPLGQIDPSRVPADTGYQDLLNGKLNEILGDAKNPSEKMGQKYEDIVKKPGG
ncbi:MAG: hypothetical protein QOE20_3977 [Mycobacterium sp.]|nr:hypothetical protein [Mycobacterium sp.]